MNVLSIKQKSLLIPAIFNILGIMFIYFVPTLSHITQLPVYLLEPMRIVVILAMLHGNKTNAYILALTLPLFSFIVSGHPLIVKSALIATELFLNVFLFYRMKNNNIKVYLAVFISIIASKIAYYLLKFATIKLLLFDSNLFSTSFIAQIGVTLLLSIYAFAIIKYSANRE